MQELANRLTKRLKHLKKWARREGLDAYRVYDHDIPGYPLAVDRYNDDVVVHLAPKQAQLGDDEGQAWKDAVLAVVAERLGVAVERLFVKHRMRQKGREQYEAQAKQGVERIVHEYGLRYIVNLSDYIDTGLFLDHRLLRKAVQAQSRHKRVLNLFAYTGSFSVAAAAGGAKTVLTVDLSNTYLNWARRNLEANKLNAQEDTFVRADVLRFLDRAQKGRWDLIVLDPPSFSNSKRMDEILDIQRDHEPMIRQCLRLLAKDGRLLFSTNRHHFSLDETIRRDFRVEDVSKASLPEDFHNHQTHRAFWITQE